MKKIYSKYKSYILFFMMYAPLGAVCPLIGQYCSSIGFSGTEVGIVTSLGTCGAVLGGLVLGKIYANANNKRRVLSLMFAFAAIFGITSLYIKVFILYAVWYAIIYFFQEPPHGLSEAMVISNNENFAPIRALGAIGYAVSSYFSGLLAEKSGLSSIFYIFFIGYLISAVVALTEKEPPHTNIKEEKVKISSLFENKEFRKLLLCAFFTIGPTMANNTYFSYLYREAGGDLAGIGLAFLLMAGSEAVFMALIPSFNRKISTEKLMVIGIAVAILRFGLYSLGPSVGVLLGTFFLQGAMNGILLVETVKYFQKIVDRKYASISVSTYYALGNNFSAIVCNLIGGIVLDAAGARGVYLFLMFMEAAALVLYLGLGLNKNRK